MIWQTRMIQKYLSEFLGRKIMVPDFPQLKENQLEKLKYFGFEFLFLPQIDLRGFYPEWRKPLPKRYFEQPIIERLELSNFWVAIEKQTRPEYLCRNEKNFLTCQLGLKTRFDYGWQTVMNRFMPQIAQIFDFPVQHVRLPSVEEWSFIANFFSFLSQKGISHPDWGSRRCWEWCLNRYGKEHALIIGNSDFGGISALGWKYFGEDSWFGAMIWWRPIIILGGEKNEPKG